MADGNLRALFVKHLPNVDWSCIESPDTACGVPDLNGCYRGMDLWIEMKATATNAVRVRPVQVAWIHRRVRHGGNVWIAVRYHHPGGPRRGLPIDNLVLVPGCAVMGLAEHGLRGHMQIMFEGGPKQWPWEKVLQTLVEGVYRKSGNGKGIHDGHVASLAGSRFI